MPEIVICDTSVIFYLHRLRHLNLLKELYGTVAVPQTVVSELKQGQDEGEDVPDISDYPWIRIKSIRIPNVIGLMTDLGPGEAGVLALALEEQDALVILDDLLARRIAMLQGIRLTGTAGILLKAKTQGYIQVIAPLLKKLQSLGFWLSNDTQQNILKLADELQDEER
jgi:predicted nucleic acid-binding protein